MVLTAEEDHLVLVERRPDRLDGRRGQITAEPDAFDTRADVGAELHDLHGGVGFYYLIDGHEGPFARICDARAAHHRRVG
ncbi:hypothetical protein [Nocardia miyunensis]|uniref:hypothetical protein n=1 Tax=Nocardia miyunensis TaxID=282684 RepID=UPI001FE1C5F6|nr:hypothetical protein [Nocardia miyunensis]